MPAPPPAPLPLEEDLARRMAQPQRHRLLQGYPMVPLLRLASDDQLVHRELDGAARQGDGPALAPPQLTLDHERPLLIGVIPHTQCNPRVQACGFCTFGHDRLDRARMGESLRLIQAEIDAVAARWPALAARPVEAVYLGGGTANLTPPRELQALGAALARRFDLREAEVTLEGVPSLFRSLLFGPMDALESIPARQRRVSMGVQTFDRAQIERMGRQRFGDAATVSRVVQRAHRRGMTASLDLLFNLPGQTPAQMLEDLRVADGLGVDQICIYNLVVQPGHGTPWARDEAILAALPTVAEGAERWLALREHLLGAGFRQTTLTNFERAEVAAGPRRFRYEACSFTPQRYDALGFGPLSISTFSNPRERRAVKLLRRRAYGPDVRGGRYRSYDLYFPYEEEDLKLLHLTRALARLQVERAPYRDLFGADLVKERAAPLRALGAAGLVEIDDVALRLTPRGMFYADTVAGLLAAERSAALRAQGVGLHTGKLLRERLDDDDAHMG